MPTSKGGYTLLWIPATGLFYTGGDFFDGKQEPIHWDRSIPWWKSYDAAERAKELILARFPDAKGEIVILPIRLREGRAGKSK